MLDIEHHFRPIIIPVSHKPSFLFFRGRAAPGKIKSRLKTFSVWQLTDIDFTDTVAGADFPQPDFFSGGAAAAHQ
jgi:hypothetical protein